MTKKKFYVTTPIYYVNDEPHIGHAYTTLAADVLARYHRLLGADVYFLTGSDEHGQKVQEAAKKRKIPPKTHADELVVRFQQLWKALNISNDDFIRTTEERHVQTVQGVLQQLWDKGDIYAATYQGWYCLPDERFWTEKELVNGLCPDCSRPVESLSEQNYFFKMGQYSEQLQEYILENKNFIQPESRRNEVLGFLNKGLNDLCISRPVHRLSWGIPLPFDSDYVCYVWLDALVNYTSAPGFKQNSENFQTWWPANLHLVGKDILTTHAVYWTTTLMALGLPLPEKLFAHGWWTVSGKKMSKSLGNVVKPEEMIRDFGIDTFRYFLLREVPFGQDGDFSKEALIQRINSDLANDLSNLLSRTLTMLERFGEGKTPSSSKSETEDDIALQQVVEALLEKVDRLLSRLEFQKVLTEIWTVISHANRYIEKNAPWALAKDPMKETRLQTVLYHMTETIRIVSLFIAPFMPDTAEKITDQLGLPSLEKTHGLKEGSRWGNLPANYPITKGRGLFPRINTSSKSPDKQKIASKKSLRIPQKYSEKSLVTLDDFSRLDLRVGVVLSVEKVSGSKKLFKLQVDLGTEKRQVVAGIATKYAEEELIGKQVIVIANLQPAKIMGVESQGMLLAAGEKEVLGLATFLEEIPPGSMIR
ncbi:MAG: methionine--tRNA ligase [Nitrospiria bacterium]